MNARAFDEKSDPRQVGIPVPAPDSGRQVGDPRDNAVGPPANYGNPPEEPDSPFDLLRYWGLFLKHRWLFVGGIVISLCLGYGVTFLTTPIYRASTTIQIDRDAPRVVELRNDVREETIGESQFYQTEYELLKSRSLAARVVADLDLANEPTFFGPTGVSPWTKLRQLVFGGESTDKRDLSARTNDATGRVLGGLSLQPIPNSALVRLSFDTTSPAWAQKIVNAISDAFIKTNLERRYDATAYARNFLQDQLAQIKLKLEQSERGLVAYAQKEQIVNLDDKQPLAVADLVAINSELAKVRAERIQNEQLWRQAEASGGLGLPQLLADSSIQTLRDKRASLEDTYQDKLNTFKPDFPDMKKLGAEIKEIDRQIASAVALIKQSIEAKYDASKQEEALLVAQLGKNTNEVLDVQGRNIEYTILQREVDTNRTLYNALLQRYKDVGVAGGVGTNNISIVDTAQTPGAPFSPSLKKNMGIALVLGLLVASFAAYILELLDDTFKTPEEVEEALRIPVLGLTPLLGKGKTVEEAVGDPHSALSEALRSVRTALQFSTDGGAPKCLLVTSSRAGEGKSTISLALARNFAQLSLRVLLIDADLRAPSLHTALGCDNEVGLSNYLAGGEAKANTFRKTSTPSLTFLASGPLPPNPAELLSGPRLLSLLTLAHQKFDLVILDGPPVMGLADALLLASAAAWTLIVVGACETRRGVVKASLKRLHFARARFVGAVLSKFDDRKVGFGYGYGYGYGGTDYYGYGKDTPRLAPAAGD